MNRHLGRWIAAWLALLSVCSSLPAEDAVPSRPTTANSKPAAKSAAAKSLAPILKPIQEPLRLKLLAGVEAASLKEASVVEVLSQFADRETQAGRFSSSLVRTVQLLGRSEGPAAESKIVSLLSANDPRAVLLAADVCSTAKREAALDPLLKLADRKEYPQYFGFRRGVVDAVARYPQKPAIDFLVTTVSESNGQLKYEAARHLTRTTGQNFGGHAADWKSWWKESRSGFQFETVKSDRSLTTSASGSRSDGAGRMPWPEAVPEFYGVPIYAQRICFVIDRSKSMASTVDGETRLDRAVQELERAISGLPESDYFNIVAFDTDIKRFRRELIQATPEGKRMGISFAVGLDPGELTNCHDALMAGLDSDANLEAMLFLSDGEPTVGPIIDPFTIVEVVTDRNAFQRTTINTIGIDARGVHEEFLKQLAARNFGAYKSAR